MRSFLSPSFVNTMPSLSQKDCEKPRPAMLLRLVQVGDIEMGRLMGSFLSPSCVNTQACLMSEPTKLKHFPL